MSVIDLSKRNTNDWDLYHKNIMSSDSYVFIESNSIKLDDGQVSIVITIGTHYIVEETNTTYYGIPDDGIILNPRESIVVVANERLALPYNLFGLVTGKSNMIFKGLFISTGKINPGFNDKLKIGIYNGSKIKQKIKRNDKLCSCVFFEMESTLKIPPQKKPDPTVYKSKPLNKIVVIFKWLKENKEVIALLITFIALLAAIFNKNFLLFN